MKARAAQCADHPDQIWPFGLAAGELHVVGGRAPGMSPACNTADC